MHFQKVISKNTFEQTNYFFVGNLKVNEENSRIRIRIRVRIRIRIHLSEAWIRGSGSTPKCHGSATLVECFANFATLNVVLCFRTLTAPLPADPRAQYAAQRFLQHKRVSRAPLTLQPSPRCPTVTPLPPLTSQLHIRTSW
jgi:hypothetical protein